MSKKLFLLIVMLNLFQQLVLAQTIITYNTYYMIPPVNGCDGIWAVGPYNSADCNNGNYTISPWGCANISGTSGDTLFFALCSIPCDFISMDGTGGICLNCFLDYDFSTTVTETASTAIALYPNPATTTLTIQSMVNSPWSVVNIYSAQGALVLTSSNIINQTLNIENLSAGLYYLHLQSAEGVAVKKFEVIH